MIFVQPHEIQDKYRLAIAKAYRMEEAECVQQLLAGAELSADIISRIKQRASQFVQGMREARLAKSGLDAFMYQYDLSSAEGIALMCLAEALLRIPDKTTVDSLIKDKLSQADWSAHLGQSHSMFVNAATWGLMLTGKIVANQNENNLLTSLRKMVKKSSMPVIRKMIGQAMKILGEQFVMGRTIDDAIKRARKLEAKGYRYSYDMLGEAARTRADAERYLQAYQTAIDKIGKAANDKETFTAPGISVKLSALHPRYEFAQRDRVIKELTPRLLLLAQQAKAVNIGLTVDAEEADRLDISLDVIERVFADPSLDGWEGFGLAVQSYQKRAMALIDWLAFLARQYKRRIMLRLIKGAYWDTEIKQTQENGLADYPVFTRKPSTDVSFIACAKKILSYRDEFYPQFATHNANSLATILELVGDRQDLEFQCLHGMGEPLYDQVVGKEQLNRPCRIYAPVGMHEDLLPYLVRRLLENGANSSFVNRIVDEKLPISDLVSHGVEKVACFDSIAHPKIPLPVNMYGAYRRNSQGVDLSDPLQLQPLAEAMQDATKESWRAAPLVNGKQLTGEAEPVHNPADRRQQVGTVIKATPEQVELALQTAEQGFKHWSETDVEERARCLERMAALLEKHRAKFMALAVREAGKTLADAVAEIREATDFCYYYANQARQLFTPVDLPSPTGESNCLMMRGRGVIACISPWNFPLAIFMGQITAALVTGNSVIAKPAAQTPLIASFACQLLHEAGIPKDVLQLLPGAGKVVGARLVDDSRIKGVIFTGSTETARYINQSLAQRPGPIIPFIAETGGQNAMIVDSSALPEQAVLDIIKSAFGSAGQRCSALRVLFVQEDIADKLLTMLAGAMAELNIGDPTWLTTDVGPVIDGGSAETLQAHSDRMQQEATLLHQVSLDEATKHGSFFAPRVFELQSLEQLPREVFGPILHVIRYNANKLDTVIDSINNTGYGLTLGVQTRVAAKAEVIAAQVRVGNAYVNRTMIGAVVGVQPFGGEGLSGTGPKAGGPHYLTRLCNERVVTVNTTASGGNTTLLTLTE